MVLAVGVEYGWIDIVAITQGPIRLPGHPAGVVNYSVSLETDRAHFLPDLRNFLHSINLAEPE